jgi:hypothetical protein
LLTAEGWLFTAECRKKLGVFIAVATMAEKQIAHEHEQDHPPWPAAARHVRL